MQEILSTKLPELFSVCEAVASPNLPLTGDTLGTHWLLKAFSSSKCDVKGYHVNFMWHLRELHFKF